MTDHLAIWTAAAAWAQAFLSAGAIVATGLITNRDRHETRRLQLVDLRSAMFALLWHVHKGIEAAAEAIGSADADAWLRFQSRWDEDRWQRSLADLSNTPVYALGDWQLVDAAICVREAGFELAELMRASTARKAPHRPSSGRLAEIAQLSHASLVRLATAIHDGPVDPPTTGGDLVEALVGQRFHRRARRRG